MKKRLFSCFSFYKLLLYSVLFSMLLCFSGCRSAKANRQHRQALKRTDKKQQEQINAQTKTYKQNLKDFYNAQDKEAKKRIKKARKQQKKWSK